MSNAISTRPACEPLTIRTALDLARILLDEAGVESPHREAQRLLAWSLRLKREDLAREPEMPVAGRGRIVFEKAVALRCERRPLHYITGEQYFYGRPFKINRAVLIPRSDTEIAVEAVLSALRDTPQPKIADVGTGSGCIAVTLACERPDARLWATDLSENALKLARKNVARHRVQDRLLLCHGDLLEPIVAEAPFDAIVSNPPYITQAEMPGLQPEVRDYEPALALSGLPGATGADGTDLHRRLIRDSLTALAPHGRLIMEVGCGQAPAVVSACRQLGYDEVTVQEDLAGIDRIVTARKPTGKLRE